MAFDSNNSNELSDFKLKFNYWFITHKFLLKKWLTIFLIVVDVVLIGYVLYRSSIMFFIEQPKYLRLINSLPNNLVDYQYFRQVDQPQALQIGSFTAIPNGESGTDFVINLKNNNADWLVKSVDVQLVSGADVIATKTIYVFPGDEKYVAFFNQQGVNTNAARITLANIYWQRYKDFSSVAEPRLKFDISNIKLDRVNASTPKGTAPVSSLSFTITNNSAYSYWSVGVYMILLGGNNISAVNYLAVDQLKAGESRTVSVNWSQALPGVSSYKILPEVNILDPSVYMPVE